jgi:hypothetical protein
MRVPWCPERSGIRSFGLHWRSACDGSGDGGLGRAEKARKDRWARLAFEPNFFFRTGILHHFSLPTHSQLFLGSTQCAHSAAWLPLAGGVPSPFATPGACSAGPRHQLESPTHTANPLSVQGCITGHRGSSGSGSLGGPVLRPARRLGRSPPPAPRIRQSRQE